MENTEFHTIWKEYEPLIQAIVELFHPFVEAAVHDVEKGVVVAIYHNISQRKVGDNSPLKDLKVEVKDFPSYFSPYYKQNIDGRVLKCTSITMRNKKGKAIGLICINVDVSFFQTGQQLLESFLKIKKGAENPIEIFGSECEEVANQIIEESLQEKGLSLNHLNRSQKKELVRELYKRGVFNFKKAAPFIAQKLRTSRASIYNYIKES